KGEEYPSPTGSVSYSDETASTWLDGTFSSLRTASRRKALRFPWLEPIPIKQATAIALTGNSGLLHSPDDFFQALFGNGQCHSDITFARFSKPISRCCQNSCLLKEHRRKFCGTKAGGRVKPDIKSGPGRLDFKTEPFQPVEQYVPAFLVTAADGLD